MRIACKFRNSYPEMFYKNSSSENFGTFSWKYLCWGTILIKRRLKNCNLCVIELLHKCFSGSFSKFWEQSFYTWGQLFKCLVSILDTWIFHQFISIYHSKSHSLATSYYCIYWNILYIPFCFYCVSFPNL